MITVTKNKETNRLNIQFSGSKFYNILQFVKYYKCKFIPATKSWESTDELKDIPKFLNELKLLDDTVKIDNVIYDNNKPKKQIEIKSDNTDPQIKGWKIKLYEHQKGDINFLLAHHKCLLANEMGCVDKDTEFFNGYKWKKISEYNVNDLVLQYDQHTQEATLCKPIKYIKQKCDNLYYFKTKYGINQCLSAKHEILYLNKQKEYKKITCEEMVNIHNKLVNGFNGKFITTFKYNGKGLNLSDAEIKVMLAVIADGYFPSSTNRCVIHIKKENKILELRKILKEADIQYKEIDRKNYNCIKKSDCEYHDFIFYAPRREKIFTKDWYNCTQEQLQLICDNVLKWDGSNQNFLIRKIFFTTIKENADFIQFAFSACNLRASIYINNRLGRIKIVNGKRYITKSIDYRVIISNNINPSLQSSTKAVIENYIPIDGYEYCFTVPTHNLILRRNENIFITGNCGKTISLVGGAIKLYELKQIKKVLIVCPSPIIPEWLNTINNHTNFKCTDIRKNRTYNTKTMFNITSIDMVYNDFMKRTDKNEANRKINNLDIKDYDLLIIDEAHKCANKNLRFKALRSIAHKIPRCWLASGTPLQNKLQEVYNLFTAFISKDLITWPYFTHHFCEKGGFLGKEIIGYKNLDEFSQLISPFVRRVTKKSLGDIFVKKYEIRHWLPMSKEEMKFYENVKDQVIELAGDPLKEKKIRIAEELVLVNYLKQICNSLYEIDETKKVSTKINKIEELLKEWNNEKVIIYSFYKKTSKLLYDTLSKNYNCYIYNGENSKKLDQAKEWFKQENNNVFIMSKVGTEGLNFNFCKKMIFLSLDYNPAILQQISDRIHRINSKEDVEIHYLIHEKTYEEHIMQIVDAKRNLQDSVINCLSLNNQTERDIILNNV